MVVYFDEYKTQSIFNIMKLKNEIGEIDLHNSY